MSEYFCLYLVCALILLSQGYQFWLAEEASRE